MSCLQVSNDCCDYTVLDRNSAEKEIVPVWAFHVKETNIEGVTVNYELRVHAQTGKYCNSKGD